LAVLCNQKGGHEEMNFRRKFLSLLVFALVISLASVSGVQGQATKNPDTLVYMTIGGPQTLDPVTAYDTASNGIIYWNMYETLLFYQAGRSDRYVPMLATEVPSIANGGISRDGRTYTFRIRQGVRFHDGSTLTAEDVKYSLMRFMLVDQDGGPSWILLDALLGEDTTRDDKGVLKADIWNRTNRAIQVQGNNVAINLTRPFGPFLNIMASWSAVTSKRCVVAAGGWDGSAGTLTRYNNPKEVAETTLFNRDCGTGPYRLERWDRATETVVLVRNDTYWRARAPLQRLVARKVEEFAARRLALQNGDADIISVDRPDLPAVQGLAGVRIVDDLAAGLTSPAIFMTLNINTEGNPDIGSGRLDGNGVPANFFSDIRVRRGFAHLFDRQRWINEVNRGKGRVANGPVPFGILGYHPRGQWHEVSRERAIAEFREAHGGQLWERGFKFTLSFNSGNVGRQTAAQMLKEAAEAINPKFQIDVRGITWANYLSAYRTKKLPMFLLGWHFDYADPHNFAFPFMHSKGTFSSVQSYNNPEVDKLIEDAVKEVDTAKRQAMYARLQEFAYRDIPTIYIVYPVGLAVMRSWVRGWYDNPAFPAQISYLYRYRKQ
jgi:peptide/nickel transport system substrate-binding protein